MAGSAWHITAMVQAEVAPRDDMARRPDTHVFPAHQRGGRTLPTIGDVDDLTIDF
jgi:hypothetical protein